jgi:hypothetical protein
MLALQQIVQGLRQAGVTDRHALEQVERDSAMV